MKKSRGGEEHVAYAGEWLRVQLDASDRSRSSPFLVKGSNFSSRCYAMAEARSHYQALSVAVGKWRGRVGYLEGFITVLHRRKRQVWMLRA